MKNQFLNIAHLLIPISAVCALVGLMASTDRVTGQSEVGGDGIASATTVLLDSSTDATISLSTDEDFFKLVLSSTTDVGIFNISTVDLDMELLDANGNATASNVDGRLIVGPKNFFLRKSLTAGTYYIKVYTEFFIGDYTLYVRQEGAGSSRSTAPTIDIVIPALGDISSSSDADFFKITTTSSKNIAVYSHGEISLKGELLGSGATPLAQDGESGAEDFIFEHSLPAGTHYVKVSSTDDDTGPYVLHLVEQTDNTNWLTDCRSKTNTYDDPLFGCQWHLKNNRLNPGSAGKDINVETVWTAGNLGQGVKVVVVDNGIDPDHEDLNVDMNLVHDYTGDGILNTFTTEHGTNVAGVIGAINNKLGLRGVAPGVTLGAHNMSAAPDTSARADAVARNVANYALSSNSYSFAQPGTLGAISSAWNEAIKTGITSGNGGKGVLYAFAGGNEHHKGGNANLDEIRTHYGVMVVCAINDDDVVASYSNRGANLWICAPSDALKTPREPYRIATTYPVANIKANSAARRQRRPPSSVSPRCF